MKESLVRWRLPIVSGVTMVLFTQLLYLFIAKEQSSLSLSRSLEVDDLQWVEVPPEVVSSGAYPESTTGQPAFSGNTFRINSGAAWFVLELNPAERKGESILEVTRADISEVALVTVFPDGSIEREKVTAVMDPSNRPMLSRRLALSIPEGGSQTYLFLRSDFPGVSRLVVWETERGFHSAFRWHDNLISLYLGIVGILWILNAFVYCTTRDSLYLDYALFLFFHGASTLVYEGYYAGTYLTLIAGIHQILMVSIPLSVFWVLRFAERFLGLHQQRGFSRWAIRGLSFVYLVFPLQLLFLGFPAVWAAIIQLQSFTVLVTGFCLLLVAAAQTKQGGKAQLIFLLAFIPHVMAVSIFLMGRLGITAEDPAFYYKLIVGSIIEMVLISLALAVAVRDAIRQREEANREALDASERARRVESQFRVELEKQVEVRTEELAQADRQKAHLLSILAHDLRSPLNSIVQISDFSLRQGSEKGLLGVVSSIYHTGRSLYGLLENLLSWARLNWEGREPSMEIISLSVILDPVLDLYREPIEHNELNLVGKESWDVVICADRAMIRTLLRNLLSNAIQYTPKGGKIRFSSQAVEDGKIRLGVANSGEAIPQEVMDGLMREESDPDATGRRGRDASEIASGLGLLLCREVVRAHAGVMTFRQIEGFGPLIEFELATETIAE